MKTIWKASVCIVAVLLSFSIYSCGDDDDETVGSRVFIVRNMEWSVLSFTRMGRW